MSDVAYIAHPNGGVIGKVSRRCMQPISVRGAGSYIEIKQGSDELLVSEAQLQSVLDAITRAGKYLKWKECMMAGNHVERKTKMRDGQTFCSCGNPWPCTIAEHNLDYGHEPVACDHDECTGKPCCQFMSHYKIRHDATCFNESGKGAICRECVRAGDCVPASDHDASPPPKVCGWCGRGSRDDDAGIFHIFTGELNGVRGMAVWCGQCERPEADAARFPATEISAPVEK